MGYIRHTSCRICGSLLPAPFLSLGDQPLANNLADSPNQSVPLYPLEVTRCGRCGLAQLTAVVDPVELFGEYLYTPSQSATFRRHFSMMAEKIGKLMEPGDLAVDIGSNDGLLLSYIRLQASDANILGVEPAANLLSLAADKHVPTLNEFWAESTATYIRSEQVDHRGAKVITATNVFAHVDNLHAFLRGVEILLSEDGTLIIEAPSIETMLRDGTFDLIYHEHLSYLDPYPVLQLLKDHHLTLAAVESVPVHGGSLRYYVRRETSPFLPSDMEIDSLPIHRIDDVIVTRFASRVAQVRSDLIQAVRSQNHGVMGYGAPAKATVLISYCGFGSDDICYVVDDNPLKQGKYVPGTDIPISPPIRLREDHVEAAIIFPWNIKEDIRPKLVGRVSWIITPMPVVQVENVMQVA